MSGTGVMFSVLTAAFRKAKPELHELADKLAALNGDSRRDHLVLCDLQDMPKPMALRSISRLTVTLELWTAEITTGPSDSGFTDDMATQANELIRRAFHSCLDS